MHAWEQIQISINYIEKHFSEEISIEKLAQMACLSQFYYQRLFSRLVKKPVSEYIKLRRLAKATEALQTKNKRILDIALDCGFSSHETFTRAFKDAFGMTPDEYRTNPVRLNQFVKPQLSLNYTLVDEDVPLVAEGIILEVTRHNLLQHQHFIGLTAEEPIIEMPGNGVTGVDALGTIWDSFHENKSSILNLKENGDEIGITYHGTKEGYYRYFAGAEAVTNKGQQGFDTWKLQEGQYIICSFEAENFECLVMDAVYKAHKYLFETWLPNHKLVSMPFVVERYPKHSIETAKMEIWIMPIPHEGR